MSQLLERYGEGTACQSSRNPVGILSPLMGKGRKRSNMVCVCVWWLCSGSESLSVSVPGLTRRYLELKSALLLNFLLSVLTGGFWMLSAYLSSPLLLRGYLVLTA